MVNDPRLNVSPQGLRPAEPGYFGYQTPEQTPEQPAPTEPLMPAQPTDLTTIEPTPVPTGQTIELSTDSPSTHGTPSIPTDANIDRVALAIVGLSALENPEQFNPSQLEAELGSNYSQAA